MSVNPDNYAVRDRIKQVILQFSWGNYGMDDLEQSKHDPGAQHWAEHLANAVLAHVSGDLAYAKGEIAEVFDLAAAHQSQGEQLDPGRILDILGWPTAKEANG